MGPQLANCDTWRVTSPSEKLASHLICAYNKKMQGAQKTYEILVVEDDADQRHTTVDMLDEVGFKGIGAASGREALKRCKSNPPALVLLDVGLPDVDGFALVKKLKKEVSGFLPVVIITGLSERDSMRQAVEAGADELLQKPVLPLELTLRIQSLLRVKALTDELEAKNQRLQELVHTDVLCDVPNRRFVLDQLRREVRRAQRYGTSLAVLLFDLDDFKQVNDRYGHAAGDSVLRAAAQTLMGGIRHEDAIGRLGGEEFLVVAPHIGLEEVLLMAERLRDNLSRKAINVPEAVLHVTTSVGVSALTPGEIRSASDLLAEADRALYAAKDAGRNRVAVAPNAHSDDSEIALMPKSAS